MIGHLLKYWDTINGRLSNVCLFLFLDYDGTLTPIVSAPDKAVMPKKTKRLLQELSRERDLKVAIISGRALRDVKKRVGVEDIIYSGNHGLEIEGPKIKYKNPSFVKYRPLMDKIEAHLTQALTGIRGVLIENKGLSLSVHYRLVDKERITEVKTLVRESMIMYAIKNRVRIRSGKMVFEITPPIKWDKGKITLWLLARQQAALGGRMVYPIYIGDDTTDEDAFRSLRNKGLTVAVGRHSASRAKYYLNDTREVISFLELIKVNREA